MRSFLPNHPLINAARCCANPDCDKKEAEAAVIFIQRWMRNIITKSLGRLPNRQAGAKAEAEAEPLPLKIMCPECHTAHYCNIDCQQADREHHQHQCNKDAEELKKLKEWLERNRNKENTDNDDDNDDELFQPIPPKDDCPLCTFPLPLDDTGNVYLTCCGKVICHGCNEENVRVTRERGLFPSCAFCREPASRSYDEIVTRVEKRMEVNDSEAICKVSYYYQFGKHGLPQDPKKAFDLCLRAAELGSSTACHNLAVLYEDGLGVAKDMTKARKYYEMAAEKGCIEARHNLGVNEWKKGNYQLACRHFLISAAAGFTKSLTNIATCYKFQLVTKEEYSTALTSYSNVHNDEHSIERERAAAALR